MQNAHSSLHPYISVSIQTWLMHILHVSTLHTKWDLGVRSSSAQPLQFLSASMTLRPGGYQSFNGPMCSHIYVRYP